MSVKVMTAVWDYGPADSTQRFVLLALADNASDDGGNAWPSVEELSRKCAMSQRTVIRALEALVESGYLIRHRRRGTSNLYQIVLGRLVSDKLSLTEVTNCHPVSDNLSLTEVTNCHPVSDNLSPDPSINHPINHQGEPPEARAGVEARRRRAAPPPVVINHIPDRTPGGNGYHAPAEMPEPQPDPAAEARRQAIGEMANAITDVTGISARLNKGEVIPLAIDLVDGGYTPGQLRQHYGRDAGPGVWNWYRDDWRGVTNEKRKGGPPRLKELRETIVLATGTASPVGKKMSMIERALSMMGDVNFSSD